MKLIWPILLFISALYAESQKQVILTFDDSCESHFSYVAPVLQEYGFKATFFITEGFSFETNKKDYMTWEQIAELHKMGFEIGNHTHKHNRSLLTKLCYCL